MTKPRRRLLIVEDEMLMQSLLSDELTTLGFDVVATDSVVDAKKQVKRFDPDIALIDIGLKGGLSGLHLGQYLAIQHPDIAQVFLSAVDLSTERVGEGLGLPAGAGFISKHSVGDAAALVAVIDQVVAGKRADSTAAAPIPGALETLGKKGHRVMELVAGGYSNHYIAEHLGVTQKTVEYYVDQGYKALGVSKSETRNARVDAALRYQQLVDSGGED